MTNTLTIESKGKVDLTAKSKVLLGTGEKIQRGSSKYWSTGTDIMVKK